MENIDFPLILHINIELPVHLEINGKPVDWSGGSLIPMELFKGYIDFHIELSVHL